MADTLPEPLVIAGVKLLRIGLWRDPNGRPRKAVISGATRRAVAMKYGCRPNGRPIAVRCHFCSHVGGIYWPKPPAGEFPGRPKFWDLHLDHLIPESRGGLTTSDNIVLSCRRCNIGRGNKLVCEVR